MVFNRFDLEVGVDDRVSNEPRCINYDPEKFILKCFNFFPVGWGSKSPDRCGIVADVLPESEFVINNEPEATVALWQNLGLGAGGLQVRNTIPLEIRCVWGLLDVKSYVVVKRLPAGLVRSLERRCQLRCPRRPTAVQNYEVYPKIALVLLQNGR
ncbi:hypothetical protein AVEN_231473-1 [Araneus ventricosus]|uniref:Uncharacterized protein n=1 Tax=Araneus ventricosus TaxID=182803 RepID=A0A4Y2S124_ARAVE|nr:hypothetical protein AVEN_231473-1 [Araneus ventricosus]